MRLACAALIALATSAVAVAQPVHIDVRVDIVNGSVNGDGTAWGADAFRFLQDALTEAAVHVALHQGNTADIWVAAGTYVPDQDRVTVPNPSLCTPQHCFGDGDREKSFEMRDNVALFGGFPPDPHDYHGPGQPATFSDRDPVAYETILSGDLKYDDDFQVHTVVVDDVVVSLGFTFDNYEDNSQHVVTAQAVGSNAVLDGFNIQGGIELRGAQPLFRDCVIALHEGAAVRCVGGSQVMFVRCTFSGMGCDAIIVDEGSRVELLACEPAANLSEAHATGKARIGSCSILLVIDRAALRCWTVE